MLHQTNSVAKMPHSRCLSSRYPYNFALVALAKGWKKILNAAIERDVAIKESDAMLEHPTRKFS
jgi:hypothetical protein